MKISKILILLTVVLFLKNNLTACNCAPFKIETIADTEKYPEIFLGKIKSIERLNQSVDIKDGFWEIEMIVEIEEKWKGNSDQIVKVYQSYLCPNSFQTNEDWIFFAYNERKGGLGVSLCSPLFKKRDKDAFTKIKARLNEFFPKEIPLKKEQEGIPKILIFGFIAIAFILGLVSGKMRRSDN